MRTILLSALAALALTGCATVPPSATGDQIYHYLRTNRDGSEAEHVVQYRPTRTGIAVYKWVEKCTTAAYVTAEMDPSLRHGSRFVAGKVAKDGSQAVFGTLVFDQAGPAMQIEIDPPGMGHLSERVKLNGRLNLLYDFDLADLNVILQEARPRDDFAFELPVIWPGAGPSLVRQLGQLTARYVGQEQHLGRRTARFDLIVTGPTPSTGTLWIDAKRGFIVESELGLPNHQEYRDFRLKLERVEGGGQAAWNRLTRGHYAGCAA